MARVDGRSRRWREALERARRLPEIDIWRVANLMLKRYRDEADIESAIRAEELAEEGDRAGEAIWRRIIDAIGQLENTTSPGPVH